MTALLIRRLEQVRAHLDVEHKHLIDLVYAALADSASGGSAHDTKPAGSPENRSSLADCAGAEIIHLHQHSVKVGGSS